MPKKAALDAEALIDRALNQFWERGYYALSIDDLVKATKASRYGIYGQFGGKKQLFLACFDHYQKVVVTPAFHPVEAPGADLQSIADYFAFQIAKGAEHGLPGPGCFVANAASEVAPHDAEVRAKVRAHNGRLRKGFAQALGQSGTRPQSEAEALAQVTVIFANGLWTASRSIEDPEDLRRAVTHFLTLLGD